MQLERARQGILHTPRNRLDKVRAVRKRIAPLPPEESLRGRYCGSTMTPGIVRDSVDEKELVQFCKKLGQEKAALDAEREHTEPRPGP